jgi:hypothetical protein
LGSGKPEMTASICKALRGTQPANKNSLKLGLLGLAIQSSITEHLVAFAAQKQIDDFIIS